MEKNNEIGKINNNHFDEDSELETHQQNAFGEDQFAGLSAEEKKLKNKQRKKKEKGKRKRKRGYRDAP